jgi:hypothetical protein
MSAEPRSALQALEQIEKRVQFVQACQVRLDHPCGKCNASLVFIRWQLEQLRAVLASWSPAPPEPTDRTLSASEVQSLRSGLLAMAAFMGPGTHDTDCDGGEDGPCNCGYVEPNDVVEALLMQFFPVASALTPARPPTAEPEKP